MRAEVVGGFAIGAEVNGLKIRRRLFEIIGGIGEEEVDAIEGTARAIGLCSNLAGAAMMRIVGAAVVPLVALLDADEGLPPPMGRDVKVVQFQVG